MVFVDERLVVIADVDGVHIGYVDVVDEWIGDGT